jgi:hypothetical protein
MASAANAATADIAEAKVLSAVFDNVSPLCVAGGD